jgi:hypothetical protein
MLSVEQQADESREVIESLQQVALRWQPPDGSRSASIWLSRRKNTTSSAGSRGGFPPRFTV